MNAFCSLKKGLPTFWTVLIISVVCAIYFDVCTFHFQMEWDDYWVVINEYTSRGFSPDNLIAVLTESYHGQYSPVNELYYIAIHHLVGYKAGYFHFASVVIHIINCLLLQRLLFKIAYQGIGMTQEKSRMIAWASVLIFAVHPLNVEAVAWISASKIPLYAMFYFISLILYTDYLVKKKVVYIYLSVLLFLLSFGSKEQAVVYPLCIILLDYLFGLNLKSWTNILKYISLLLLALALGIVTIISQGSEEQMGSDYNILERGLLAAYSLSMYSTQSIIPIKLSYLYPFPFEHGKNIPFYLYLYPLLMAAIVYYGRGLIIKKEIFFGLIFFLIHILVALHIVGLGRFSVTADRYAYVSLAGFCFILAFLIVEFSTRNNKIYSFKLKAYWCYIIVLGTYSSIRLQAWRDSEILKSKIKIEIRARKDYSELEKQFDQL